EEVIAGYRAQLEAEGWTLEVKPAESIPGAVGVELEHPLVPGRHSFGMNSPQMSADAARQFLLRCFQSYHQFEVVRDAPVRPERYRLLRHLRGAAMLRASEAACQAITSAGYALYEEGILV